MREGAIFAGMKKLIFFAACLVALTSQPVLAQTGGPEVVVVRVLDGNPRDLRILVSYGEGKTEVTTVKSTMGKDGQEAINETYQKVLQKLYQAGYTLKSSFSAGPYAPGFVFVKGQ
jgi:hypothetical protein